MGGGKVYFNYVYLYKHSIKKKISKKNFNFPILLIYRSLGDI